MADNSNVIGIFKVDGKAYEVLECNFGFSQNYDLTPKVSGEVITNLINLVLKITDEISLIDWMVLKGAEKDGKIILKLSANTKREIHFKCGICVNYSEQFDNHSGSSALINLAILVGEEIQICASSSEVVHKMSWTD